MFVISYCCISDVGKVREMNQDNFNCNGVMLLKSEEMTCISGKTSISEQPVFAVFDGMGGEEMGEVASYLAAQCALSIDISDDPVTSMKEYCERANSIICQYAKKNSVSAMGTTLAMLCFSEKEITLCNIGDSKIFRISKGEIEQISRDHVLQSSDNTKPPLLQNLGIPPDELKIEPYFAKGWYHHGDIYLICSDGLTDFVTKEDILRTVFGVDLAMATKRLYDLAMLNGGRDNITLILCRLQKDIRGSLRRVIKRITQRGSNL